MQMEFEVRVFDIAVPQNPLDEISLSELLAVTRRLEGVNAPYHVMYAKPKCESALPLFSISWIL